MIISSAFAAEQAAHTAAHGSFLQDPTFWVAVSFFITLFALIKLGGKSVCSYLDARAENISSKLEEAKKLREDAQALLAEYQQRQHDVDKKTEAMLQKAQEDAEKVKAEMQKQFDEGLNKREALTLKRLSMAEEKAMKEIRDLAIDISLASVEKIFSKNLAGEAGDKLIEDSIALLPDVLKQEEKAQ